MSMEVETSELTLELEEAHEDEWELCRLRRLVSCKSCSSKILDSS